MRVADYLMHRLAEAGAEHVFLLPGGGAMHLNDALACEPRLVPVPCHHEQACGIAAEAWGRVRESFGVCMVTTGPGATNVITPVAGAWIESVPMLVISGQVKRPDLLAGRPLRQGGVQEVDIVPMVKSITKYAVTLDDPKQVSYHLERALHEMLEGRQGPVWLDIPLDVQGAPIDPADLVGFTPPSVEAAGLKTEAMQLMALIAKAERPLLLAGHGVRLSGAAQAFLAQAERLQIPVVTTWNALDLLPWEHPLHAGRPGVVALRSGNFAVQNCDLLISIGCRLDNIITAYNPRGFARAARKVVIDVDAHEIEKLDMDLELAIVADAARILDALAHQPLPTERSDPGPWIQRCADWKQRYPVNDGRPFPSTGPINHYQFVSALADALPPDTIVGTGSSGLAVEVFYTIFRNKPGQRVFLTSGLGSMGYGLPAAIGACLANDSKPMVAVESDGSLQLNLQELATLAAQHLPISLIIMNNGGYASIRNTQRNYFAGRYIGTGPEAGLMLPDLEKIAATYGLPFARISDAAELPRLKELLASPGPRLIDMQLTPEETLAPKVAALPQADGAMLSMPLEDMSPLLPLEQLQAEMLIPLSPASLAARH
ncbi:thiamine pyrophosphate-binding protein [Azonexus hydrophilus]|uniref:thiamine pyrophosphate-binding protein n=1 Tax=Azonexus hydrophilus TaxID=418702 RepID=UPI001F06A5CD|nr:thiamine pyrophosphate-binding protein [Azonexus hydrophilus]